MRHILYFIMIPLLFLSAKAFSFDANSTFSVTLAKVNANGTTTDITSKSVTSDTDGKISFTFAASDVPTVDGDGVNFLVITVKNAAGETVRQSVAPAPCSGNTNEVGVNSLSDVQSKAILEGAEAAGTDDPIYASFGFLLLRSSKLSSADRSAIAACGRGAILGSGGMIEHLSNTCGASASAMSTFRQKLVCNSDSGTKDLGDYSANFKGAIDNADDTLMSEAGGFIADVFVDGWNSAGRNDLACMLAAFEAAGTVTEGNSDCLDISSAANTIVNQALIAFFQRIAGVKVRREYTTALSALGASGTLVERFNSAVSTFLTSLNDIFDAYHDEFENQSMTEADQTAMNAFFQTSFNSYISNSRTTSAEISDVKTRFAAALGIDVNDSSLNSFGSWRDINGSTVNWPIPQLVQHDWLATILNAGGSLSYTRDTLAIPSMMQWLNSRTTFNSGQATLDAREGLREDVQIIQFTFFSTFSGGGQVTREQEKNAKTLMGQRLEGLLANIGGTQNGTTAITDAQKRALIRTMLEPDFN
ncbi:MAG: hypothetical protein HY609_03965 [Deltaproteobacteria bacterium]|nr:hypothetical protein [Deltaproteobacteria bacterium]